MTKFRKLAMAAALSGAAAFNLGTGAMAATVNLDSYTLVGDNSMTASGGTLTDPVPGGSGAMHISTSAGTDTPDALIGNIVAFCADLLTYIDLPSTYTIVDNLWNSTITAAVQTLFDANYAADVTTDADKAAGFQFALWRAIYGSTLNFSGATTGALEHMADYIAAAATYTGPQQWDLVWLEGNPESQNLVTAVAVAPVPVPAAGFLLMGGLAGLGVMARRRKAAAA